MTRAYRVLHCRVYVLGAAMEQSGVISASASREEKGTYRVIYAVLFARSRQLDQ